MVEFLHTVGHSMKNIVINHNFKCYGETLIGNFNRVQHVILCLQNISSSNQHVNQRHLQQFDVMNGFGHGLRYIKICVFPKYAQFISYLLFNILYLLESRIVLEQLMALTSVLVFMITFVIDIVEEK